MTKYTQSDQDVLKNFHSVQPLLEVHVSTGGSLSHQNCSESRRSELFGENMRKQGNQQNADTTWEGNFELGRQQWRHLTGLLKWLFLCSDWIVSLWISLCHYPPILWWWLLTQISNPLFLIDLISNHFSLLWCWCYWQHVGLNCSMNGTTESWLVTLSGGFGSLRMKNLLITCSVMRFY